MDPTSSGTSLSFESQPRGIPRIGGAESLALPRATYTGERDLPTPPSSSRNESQGIMETNSCKKPTSNTAPSNSPEREMQFGTIMGDAIEDVTNRQVAPVDRSESTRTDIGLRRHRGIIRYLLGLLRRKRRSSPGIDPN